ncbi:MAG: hypothetical protein IRY94_04680 [Rhodospirillaceae bacterium]|nr:hypothetical protein [Rhodospirillaceae bacterium]
MRVRVLMALALLAPLALAACGGTTEKTVVVNPPPGSTVVVPDSGSTRVCGPGQSVC